MSVLLALLLDFSLGEPPTRAHPVVWMGRYLNWIGRTLPGHPPRQAFWLGAFYWGLGVTGVTGLYALLAAALVRLPWPLETALLALLLKPLFAFRMLLEEVGAVETALQRSLEAGRLQLSRIVSRDTSALSEAQVREAALESLSENLADSLLAPLFWYVLLGLPGAALYRFANTADALWGYHGRWEWGGKWAAKADDLLSYLPARITGLFLLAIPLAREKIPWARLVREAHKTPSPNSGWPMAALALRLGVRLGKPGVYTLNPEGRVPVPADMQAGQRQVRLVGWSLALGLGLLSLGVRHA